MARATLPTALNLMFGHEGGYVNVKTDRGGPTKYGVTHKTLAAHLGLASVTADRVKSMTLAEAEEIYRRSYWTQSGGDILPIGLDYAAFDFGVNSGPSRAVKVLQSVLGVRQDGHVGEQTLFAVKGYKGGVAALIRDYCDARMRFLRSLGGAQGFSANGRGWTIRVTGKDPKGQWAPQPGVLGNALRLASQGVTASGVALVETPAEGQAKADSRDIGLLAIAGKPEVLAPVASVLSAGGAIASGSGPIQWALAAAMVAVVGVGIWYFVRRMREAD